MLRLAHNVGAPTHKDTNQHKSTNRTGDDKGRDSWLRTLPEAAAPVLRMTVPPSALVSTALPPDCATNRCEGLRTTSPSGGAASLSKAPTSVESAQASKKRLRNARTVHSTEFEQCLT